MMSTGGQRPGFWFKRAFDVAASLALLVILAAPLAVIALLIRLDSPGPVFFRQERAGRNGRPFRIFKFRTMVAGAENFGLGVFTEADDPRITRVGRWLRRFSLDELPQLMNVLLGDMSLVGPRPTLVYQVTKYDETQKQRLAVCPGITGWAQVNGRNSLSWPERIKLDVWYVNHWSFWLDVCILLRTVLVVLNAQGLYGQRPDYLSARPGTKGSPTP